MTICIVLLAPIAAAVSLSVPPPKNAPSRGDGRLVLYSYPHKEVIEAQYRRADGTYDAAALARIAHVMRSPDGNAHAIDPQLIETLDAIQDRFGADTVEIISGFRSPTYNAQLKATGHGVARESLHMQGIAADIHLDTITEQAVRDFAQSLGHGGVGYYPSLHFVHVDLGPARSWTEAAGPRKLVGMEANQSVCRLITDRNNYRTAAEEPSTALTITLQGPAADCPTPREIRIRAEHFHRGTWRTAQPLDPAFLTKMPRPCSTATHTNGVCADYLLHLSPRVAGKYRLRATASPEIISNEFYLKQE